METRSRFLSDQNGPREPEEAPDPHAAASPSRTLDPGRRTSPIAEVVAASTREVTAEVFEGEPPPDFGAWVEVRLPGGLVLYGLVAHVEVGMIEPGRRVRAYGLDEDEIARERPHLPGLVCTTLRAVLLAHRTPQGTVRQTLPPQPARLHDHVYRCAPEAVRTLGAPFDVLRTLAQHPDPAVPVDDLLVAALTGLRAAHAEPAEGEAVLVEAARALTRLLRDDHERLHSILRRVA
jgi:hypothetical protein